MELSLSNSEIWLPRRRKSRFISKSLTFFTFVPVFSNQPPLTRFKSTYHQWWKKSLYQCTSSQCQSIHTEVFNKVFFCISVECLVCVQCSSLFQRECVSGRMVPKNCSTNSRYCTKYEGTVKLTGGNLYSFPLNFKRKQHQQIFSNETENMFLYWIGFTTMLIYETILVRYNFRSFINLHKTIFKLPFLWFIL